MILVGLVGGNRAEVDLGAILRKRLHIIGTVLRSRSEEEKAVVVRSFQAERLHLFEDGTLVPVIDKVFPLQEISQAHTYMEQNRNFGKIVLTL
jgi:NADPH:quinone reductase-like Zn-dependent oxidoreductase